jgi:hypothetical protein
MRVGAELTMHKYGLPEGGLRLSIPQKDRNLLAPLVCVAIPRRIIDIQLDGVIDFYLTLSGRMGGDLAGISDLLENA